MKKQENSILYAELPIGDVSKSLNGLKKSIFPTKAERLNKMKKDLKAMREEVKVSKEFEEVLAEKRSLAKPSLFSAMWKKARGR